MIFLAIDPGMDLVAVAVFDSSTAKPGSLGGALKGWTHMLTFSTDSSKPTNDRCAEISDFVAQAVRDHGASVAFIEEPAKSGAYARNKGLHSAIADGLMKLNRGIGAIAAGAHAGGARLVEMPANRARKEDRHNLLRMAATRAGIGLPVGPRGGKREDEWDALWIGCEVVNNRLLKEVA